MQHFISIPNLSQIWTLNPLGFVTDHLSPNRDFSTVRKQHGQFRTNYDINKDEPQFISIHSWKSKKVLWKIDMVEYLYQGEFISTMSLYSTNDIKFTLKNFSESVSTSTNTKSFSTDTPTNEKSNITSHSKADKMLIEGHENYHDKLMEKHQDNRGNHQLSPTPLFEDQEVVWLGTSRGRILIFSPHSRKCIMAFDLYTNISTTTPTSISEEPQTIFGASSPVSSLQPNSYLLSTISGKDLMDEENSFQCSQEPQIETYFPKSVNEFPLSSRTHSSPRLIQSSPRFSPSKSRINSSNGAVRLTNTPTANKTRKEAILLESRLLSDSRGKINAIHFSSCTDTNTPVAFIALSVASLILVNVSTMKIIQRFDNLHSRSIEHIQVVLQNATDNLENIEGRLPDSSTEGENLISFHNQNNRSILTPEKQSSKINQKLNHTTNWNVIIITTSMDHSVKFWKLTSTYDSISCFLTIDNLVVNQLLIVTHRDTPHTSKYELWIACGDSKIRVWDLELYREKYVLKAHSSSITSLCKLEEEIWSSSSDRTICVWDTVTGDLLKQFPTGDSYIHFLIPVAKASVYRLWSINESDDAISTRIWDAQNTFEYISKATASIETLQDMELENSHLSESLNLALERSQSLEDQNFQMQSQVTDLEIVVKTLQEDKEINTKYISELNESLKKQQIHEKSLEDENSHLKKEVAKLRKELQDFVNIKSNLEHANITIESQQIDIGKLKVKVENQEEVIKNCKNEISHLVRSLAKSEVELKWSNEQNHMLSEKLNEIKDKKFTLEAGKSFLSMRLDKYEPILSKLEKSMRDIIHDDHSESENEENGEDVSIEDDNQDVDFDFLSSNLETYLNFVRKSRNLDRVCLAYRKNLDDMLSDIEETKTILLEKERGVDIESDSMSISDVANRFSNAVEEISIRVLQDREQSRLRINQLNDEISHLKNERNETIECLDSVIDELKQQEVLKIGVDKLIKLGTALHSFPTNDEDRETIEDKINFLLQVFENNIDQHKRLVSELTQLENTVSDMCDLLQKFVESTPEFQVNPLIFGNAESSIIRSIAREMKRSAEFLFNSKDRLPNDHICDIDGYTSNVSSPNTKSNFNNSIDSTLSKRKIGGAVIIKHANPSPRSKQSKSNIKPNVDITPAEPSIEFKQNLLRLRISENCLRIAHLYKQADIVEELRRKDSQEAKKNIQDKMKLTEKVSQYSYIVTQTIDVLQNMIHVFVEKSKVSIPSFVQNIHEEPHKRLFRQLEHLQKAVEKIILSLQEQHENTKSKLQQLRIKKLNQ